VATLKTLTKPEFLAFYVAHVDPLSPGRRKVSVHMQSQIEPKEPSLEELAVSGLAAFLTEKDLSAPLPELQKIVAEAGVANGPAIGTGVRELLLGSGADEAKVDDAMAVGMKLLADQVAAMQTFVETSKATVVEDPIAFKASLPLSAGATPVHPLELYTDPTAKL